MACSDDLHIIVKQKEREMEFLMLQDEFIRDEQKNLRKELIRAAKEIKRIQSVPLVIGQFLELIDPTHAIVSSAGGSNYFVRLLSTIDK